MTADETRRRSRWMMRMLEWDDPRARYPNLWRKGMPCQIVAFDTVASRLRLGDLIAVYHPTSQKHPQRSERFVGIARVTGLRRAHEPTLVWVDLETAHRFDPPLDLGEPPRRVFLCCDPGWPEREVMLFQRVFDAAVAAGWRPSTHEAEGAARARPGPTAQESARLRAVGERAHPEAREKDAAREGDDDERHEAEERGPTLDLDERADEAEPVERTGPSGAGAAGADAPGPRARPFRPSRPLPEGRLFGGVDYSGDMRDPKNATWLALVELVEGDRLRLARLEATGRAALHSHLRNPDAELMRAEALGLDFPFGLPIPFAEALLGGPFPEEGWWALARRLEKMTRPEYLVALQEFREANGETKRFTDEVAGAFSPLHRVNPDLGPMTYHGIRMIAEERSRFALRPFESAQGKLLLEVYPGGSVRKLGVRTQGTDEGPTGAILDALERAPTLPVVLERDLRDTCLANRDAADAVVAARAAALAVLTGEADLGPERLAPEEPERVRREGWIYGLRDDAVRS